MIADATCKSLPIRYCMDDYKEQRAMLRWALTLYTLDSHDSGTSILPDSYSPQLKTNRGFALERTPKTSAQGVIRTVSVLPLTCAMCHMECCCMI